MKLFCSKYSMISTRFNKLFMKYAVNNSLTRIAQQLYNRRYSRRNVNRYEKWNGAISRLSPASRLFTRLKAGLSVDAALKIGCVFSQMSRKARMTFDVFVLCCCEA